MNPEMEQPSMVPKGQLKGQGKTAKEDLPDAPLFSKTKRNKGSSFETPERKSKWKKMGISIASVFVAGFIMYNIFAGTIFDTRNSHYKNRVNLVTNEIVLTADDLDKEKTQEAITMLKNGSIPPELENATPEMRQQIADQSSQLYSVTLFDDCAEDGDIVDVIVDSVNIGRVAINHSGSTIYIPVSQGHTPRIQFMGIDNGNGPITIAARTSSGETFFKDMAVGELVDVNLKFGQ